MCLKGIISLTKSHHTSKPNTPLVRCMQLILAVKNIVMKQCLIRLDGPLKDLLFDTDNHLFICYSFFYSLSFLRHVFLSCYYFILIFLIIIIIIILNNL